MLNINAADVVVESTKIIREILNFPGSEDLKIAAFDALESIARPAATTVQGCTFYGNGPPKAPKKAKAKKAK
jgi:hypothetical protein